MKGKGLRNFQLLERNDQGCCECDSRGAGFFSNWQPSLTGLSKWRWLKSHEGYVNKGLAESSFMISKSCWSQVCDRWVAACMPWEAVAWSFGVKPGLLWRSQNVDDARATGDLPGGAAGWNTRWKEKYLTGSKAKRAELSSLTSYTGLEGLEFALLGVSLS